jgi:putative ABC transport system ATP-binding protein
MSDPLIEVRGAVRRFDGGKVEALRGVDLTILEGEFVAVAGPSGSGKSTLLQLLGALDTPDEGDILFRSQSLRSLPDPGAFRSRNIGFVFQSFHLMHTLTAVENVQMPMFEMPWSARERRRRAENLLGLVGLDHRLDHLPSKLSGGERQRVAIARSLANEPLLLLADEPTGNLDTASAGRIMQLFEQIHRDRGMTIIMVTHDPNVAACARRVIHMLDGRIASDTPTGGVSQLCGSQP